MLFASLLKKSPTYNKTIDLDDGRKLIVDWTETAEKQLRERSTPLIVEMQLYFSCTVQKLVYFHDAFDHPDIVTLDDRLKVCFQPIKASVCDPVEFARSHPTDYQFTSDAAKKMSSKHLTIDWVDGGWQGKFSLLS